MRKPATTQELADRLKAIDADERYHYKAATVFENAPLALIQLEMETEARIIAWVLGAEVPKR